MAPIELGKKTINQSEKVELEKKLKRMAEEIRKQEQPAIHQEENDTLSSECYDCLYTPYIKGISESKNTSNL